MDGRSVRRRGEAGAGGGTRRNRTARFIGLPHHHFLSSAINDRRDQYGGGLENRARFLMEVSDAVREEVGRDFHMQLTRSRPSTSTMRSTSGRSRETLSRTRFRSAGGQRRPA